MNNPKEWLVYLPALRNIRDYPDRYTSRHRGICDAVVQQAEGRAEIGSVVPELRDLAIAVGHPGNLSRDFWFAGYQETLDADNLWADGKRMALVEKMIEFLENLEREDK